MKNLNSIVINKGDKIKPVFYHDLDNTRTVVFSTDNNFIKYFAVTLQSLIEISENNKNYDIIVFENEISDNYKSHLLKMIPENFSLRFFDINNYIKDNFDVNLLTATDIFTFACWYRCFIPLIMANYKKVLYADIDVIFNKPLEELFNIDFENKEILAVKDTVAYKSKTDFKLKNYIEQTLKLDSTASYFNSGIIMFNLERINTEEYYKDFTKALALPELHYLDQDVLNAVFNKKKKLIPFNYNFQYHVLFKAHGGIETYPENVRSARENPVIIHYTTTIKPWKHPQNEFCIEWWQHARKTPFYEDILYTNIKINSQTPGFFKNLIQNIFSIKNDKSKRHNVITILGIKIKIKIKRNNKKK